MEISFCSHPNTKKVIATIFGTWHDSWAVVACAKFCRDIIISNWIRAKWNFHRIWIVMEKSLVKWVPGLKPDLNLCAVLCCCNAVNFLTNIHKRHPIPRPNGQGKGCLLWVHHLIDILPQFLQLFMQYLTILDQVITALECMWNPHEISTLNS